MADYMTLRDSFAMAALTGVLTMPEYSTESALIVARLAYEQADAMLAERAKEAAVEVMLPTASKARAGK